MKKIKLVYIITLSTFGGDQIGGAQVHLLNLIRNLDMEKFDVSLIAGNEGVLTREVEKLGVPFYINDLMDNPVKLFKDLKALRKMRCILRSINPDIVHSHSSKGGFLGRVAAYKEQVPVIIFSVQGFAFPRVKGLKRYLYLLAERFAGARTDKMICASIKDKEDAINHKVIRDLNKLTVINNGFDQEINWEVLAPADLNKRYGIEEGTFTAAMIARLDEQKNPLEFLMGIRGFIKNNPDSNVKFLLIGQGTEKESCIRFIHDNKLEDFIITGDWLRLNPDYFQVLKAVDLMVLPSLWEGLPLAIIDSMRMGTPVLASGIPGTVELIEDGKTGLLYQSRKPEDLAAKLEWAVKNPELLKKISYNAKQKVINRLSYKHITEIHMKFYEELLIQNKEIKD